MFESFKPQGERRAIVPPPPIPRETASAGPRKRESAPDAYSWKTKAVAAFMQGVDLVGGVSDLNELRTSDAGRVNHPVVIDEVVLAREARKKERGRRSAEGEPESERNRPTPA